MLSSAHPTSSSAFDVLVIGAGPGGTSAAAAALKRGLSVAQLDRHAFPRVKPCGGGITIKSSNALAVDLAPVLRGEARAIELNVWRKRQNQFTRRATTMLRMVVRSDFDNWLVDQNRRFERYLFLQNERVLEIEYDGALFLVRTSSRMIRARHLVGADGAYSLVNRQFRVTQPKGMAVAVEVTLGRDSAALDPATPPCFDFGAIARGYGWVFPKDDHWNVGLYTLDKQHNLREDLVAYVKAKGFRVSGDPLATFVGHRFPYGGYRVNVPAAPVYVVGDAGGFGDPLMGEGIYHAIESGRVAGETIADCLDGVAQPADYYKRIAPTVLLDTRVTYFVGREFYRDVDKALTILENPFIWRPFIEGYAGGATFSRSLMHAWRLLPRAFARGVDCQRDGDSLSLALPGPFRGLAYLCEPVLRRVQRRLGIVNPKTSPL